MREIRRFRLEVVQGIMKKKRLQVKIKTDEQQESLAGLSASVREPCIPPNTA
jgi:hypothetical protein